jgi:hypothetical protein
LFQCKTLSSCQSQMMIDSPYTDFQLPFFLKQSDCSLQYCWTQLNKLSMTMVVMISSVKLQFWDVVLQVIMWETVLVFELPQTLKAARQLGDFLLVGIHTDLTIRCVPSLFFFPKNFCLFCFGKPEEFLLYQLWPLKERGFRRLGKESSDRCCFLQV